MFGTANKAKVEALVAQAALLVAMVTILCPSLALAEYAEMLGGSPNRTLRSPLIPGAANAFPGQSAYQGQPPAMGSGPIPNPVNPGDLGGSHLPPSGYADPTHGNMFSTRNGSGPKGPWVYVPGAGRRGTTGGQHQGVFEFNQNVGGQTQYEPGQGNGGQAMYEAGAGGNGQGLYEAGIGNGGQSRFEAGAGNNGQGTFDGGAGNGGAGLYEGGRGNGGMSSFESGAGNGGQGIFDGGAGNGGAGVYEPGKGNGGQSNYEAGAGNGGQGTFDGGAGNGGAGTFEQGKGNGGNKLVEQGGGNGGNATINNGGPRGDAEGSGDRLFSHSKQGNRYDFNGPLPTVRTFSRYLVILGVVFATVFVSMAAWSMVMGGQYGAARVMGAVGGLLMLLAGYTIYKIVQMNTFHANSTGYESHYRDGSAQPVSQKNGPPQANGPFVGPQNPGN